MIYTVRLDMLDATPVLVEALNQIEAIDLFVKHFQDSDREPFPGVKRPIRRDENILIKYVSEDIVK